MDTVPQCALALLALLVLGGCKTETSFEQVQIVGLPTCAAGKGLLVNPVKVELNAHDATLSNVFMGSDATPAISMPVVDHTWKLRVGLCQDSLPNTASYRCTAAKWYHEREIVIEAEEVASKKIMLPPPPERARCWGDVRPTSSARGR